MSAGRGLGLVGRSLLVYLMPILSIACIGLLFSTVFRNSGAAIVEHPDVLAARPADRHPARASAALHPYLLSTQFDAWQGFLRVPVDWAPILRGLWVCALYALPALVAAALVFLRRDVAGD